MAITKIHPIKSTLNLAIKYITNAHKTDENILISSFNCFDKTAHIQFNKTRDEFNTKGTVLARHLIQSFYPGETTPELAHKIGIELCKKVLGDDYEYILATHIDKGHIHNHIIFNNVSFVTGKCYQSNKRTYHKIRNISDKLCKENNLSVIDEFYEKYKSKYKKHKTNDKSWYEYDEYKKGNSWKSRLQFDIDRCINKSTTWEEFLDNMKKLNYEIKFGKHIAFKHKDKERYTRAKTIGEDYTEVRIKERILERVKNRASNKFKNKKRSKNIIDIENNEKAKLYKGYEIWARKHNLKTISESIIELRNMGINSVKELDTLIQKSATNRQNIMDKIKEIESEIDKLSDDIENAHTIIKYRQIYLYHKENIDDREFENEYKKELTLYKKAAENILNRYDKMPDTKEILEKLEQLHEKKNTLMNEYSYSKNEMDMLYKLRKNYESYMGKEMER